MKRIDDLITQLNILIPEEYPFLKYKMPLILIKQNIQLCIACEKIKSDAVIMSFYKDFRVWIASSGNQKLIDTIAQYIDILPVTTIHRGHFLVCFNNQEKLEYLMEYWS